MTALAWGAKVSPEFRRRVMRMAQRLACDPSWLMAVMAFESGRTFRADVRNAQSGATGLIQFMPGPGRSADALGTTTDALAAMSAVAQLEYVERYFSLPWVRAHGRMQTLADAYMAVLWPAAVGESDDYVLFASPSTAYQQNRGLDTDNDGKVTKAEAAAIVARDLAEGAQYATEERDTREDDAPAPEISHMDPANTLAAVAGLFNPIAGGILAALAPVVQAKIAKAITRQTDDPAASQAAAAQIGSLLVSQAKALTGETDSFRAAAAITQDPAQADNLAKLAANVSATVDQMMAAGDKAATWDQAMWQAELAGRNAASARYIAERAAGGWDMTPVLVWGTVVLLGAISIGLLAAIGVQAFSAERQIDPALIGLAGPIWTGAVVAGFVAIIAYRFDGSKSQTEQSHAILRATFPPPGGQP